MNARQTTYHVNLHVEAESRADWDISPTAVAEAVQKAMARQQIIAIPTPDGMVSITVTAVAAEGCWQRVQSLPPHYGTEGG